MDINMFSPKELYDVVLKATYPIEMGNKKIDVGEIVLAFDNILLAEIKQEKDFTSAKGGFDNKDLVNWEKTKEVNFSFTQGVFSLDQLALATNSKIIKAENSSVPLTKREKLESDENGVIVLSELPIDKVFVYEVETGERIPFVRDAKQITIDRAFLNISVDYTFSYTGKVQTIKIGRPLLNGYLSLEAKTRLRDDVSGQVVTGVFLIPKLKIMSDLSIQLGEHANPAKIGFSGVGVPVGPRQNTNVFDFVSLGDDIDSDL